MIDIREITSREDFNSFIETNKGDLHVVKFSANWCQPCKVLGQRIKNLDLEKIGKTLFAEIDVSDDATEELANEFGISNIPVMAYIKNGEVKTMTTGLVSTDDIYKKINEMA